MATKLTRKKPNFAKSVSHAKNRNSKKQSVNLQTTKINGEKVIFSAREARTLKKKAA